jgi:rubrerythrin
MNDERSDEEKFADVAFAIQADAARMTKELAANAATIAAQAAAIACAEGIHQQMTAELAAQAAEIERLKGERQMSAGFDPASDNGDESAVILMCFNCAYAGPRGEDDEGNVCCPECGARAMEASNG